MVKAVVAVAILVGAAVAFALAPAPSVSADGVVPVLMQDPYPPCPPSKPVCTERTIIKPAPAPQPKK